MASLRGPEAARPIEEAGRGRRGPPLRPRPRERARGPPRADAGTGPSMAREAPSASGTPYPPTTWRRSTFGEAGLNFRVRNGIG